MLMRPWVRLPSSWIDTMGLCALKWTRENGSSNTAALMVLMVLAHHANDVMGTIDLTYDKLQLATTLSRSKISKALSILQDMQLITRFKDKQSTYRLSNYQSPEKGGWAKLPAKRLYDVSGRITMFQEFHLRSRAELDALKLYYLFVGRRSSDTNTARISYDKIAGYTGIDRSYIRRGISLLIEHQMIQTEQHPSIINEHAISNAYRISGIEPHQHQGTTGRRSF